MRSRTWTAAAVGSLGLALGGCGGGADQTPRSTTGGAVELAVAHTCAPGADLGPDCVEVNGERVSVPTTDFERAGVDDVSTGAGSDTIHLTFDDDGSALLRSSSAEVAAAGDTARLAIRVDEHVLAAVRVPEPLDGADVQLVVPDDTSAEDLVALIQGG